MEVEIFWEAFKAHGKEVQSLKFEIESDLSDIEFLEMLFQQTNLYQGTWWDEFHTQFPEGRSHTALSVGDKVRLEGLTYTCADFGWKVS